MKNPSSEERSLIAREYMSMTLTSGGWKYLRAWIEESIEGHEKAVMSKEWTLFNEKDTAKRHLEQTQAHTLKEILKHVDGEVKRELERREKPSQGDS